MTYGLVVAALVMVGGRSGNGSAGWSSFRVVVTIPAQTNTGGMGGTGSAEIIRPGGFILTNDHVISPAVNGGTVVVGYSDGRSSPPPLWDETS